MSLTSKERNQISIFAKKLVEARDNSFAEYEVKKDKVIAYVSKQKGSAFTKLAEEWRKFEKLEADLAERKRALNTDLQAAKTKEDELKDQIREKVISIFDDSENMMSLAVNCLNSSFTVSKYTDENKDTTVAKKGDYIETDYKKVLDLLLDQLPDLQKTADLLIKQCSTLAVEDIVKPGKKRRASITTTKESVIYEGLWDKIINVFNKLATKFKQIVTGMTKRQQQIDALIMQLETKRKSIA